MIIKLPQNELWSASILKSDWPDAELAVTLAPKKWSPPSVSCTCGSYECGNDLRETSKGACGAVLWLEKISRPALLGLSIKLWSVTPHSLNNITSTTGEMTDVHVGNFKTVTISRRNYIWRRASCRAMSNCFHLPRELLDTDCLCQLSAWGSTRPFSFIGRQRGDGGACQARHSRCLYRGLQPWPWCLSRGDYRKPGFLVCLMLVFHFLVIYFLSVYLLPPECKLCEGKGCCLFRSLLFPQHECPVKWFGERVTEHQGKGRPEIWIEKNWMMFFQRLPEPWVWNHHWEKLITS